MGKRRANGEGTIYYRKSTKRWIGTCDVAGQRYYVSATTRTQAAARLAEARKTQSGGLVGGEQTVRDYLNHWAEHIIKVKIRHTSHLAYRTRLGHLIPHLGTIRLQDLRAQHIQACYAALLDSGMAPATVRAIHVALSSALQRAVKDEVLGKNPALAVELPRVPKPALTVLSREQLRRLMDGTTDDRFHALWTILATTGLRIGEALALRWDDINVDAAQLQVRRTLQHKRGAGLVTDDPKTASSRRTVHLTSRAVTALRAQQQQQRLDRLAAMTWEEHDLVFPTRRGTLTSEGTIGAAFKRTLTRCELPEVRVHDLRHSLATMLLRDGVHVKVVSEMLGHASITITLQAYAHVLPSMHQEAMGRLDELLAEEA